jgi:hypothetical protein
VRIAITEGGILNTTNAGKKVLIMAVAAAATAGVITALPSLPTPGHGVQVLALNPQPLPPKKHL